MIKIRVSTSNKEAKILKSYLTTVFFLMANMERLLWYSKTFIYFGVEQDRIAASPLFIYDLKSVI